MLFSPGKPQALRKPYKTYASRIYIIWLCKSDK